MSRQPSLEIVYCRQCHWLPRASWMAQEFLNTFAEELAQVALVPGTGGIFEIRLDGERLWSRQERGRFPEPREIKQMVRDVWRPVGRLAIPTARYRTATSDTAGRHAASARPPFPAAH